MANVGTDLTAVQISDGVCSRLFLKFLWWVWYHDDRLGTQIDVVEDESRRKGTCHQQQQSAMKAVSTTRRLVGLHNSFGFNCMLRGSSSTQVNKRKLLPFSSSHAIKADKKEKSKLKISDA